MSDTTAQVGPADTGDEVGGDSVPGGKPGLIRIRRGLDLPLAGTPEQVVESAEPATTVAVLGADFVGLKPRLVVAEGERVRRGQTVIEDKAVPGVRHTAPAAGEVIAINRGDKRAFQSVVIAVEEAGTAGEQVAFESYRPSAPHQMSAAEVTGLLVESGLWTALRTRPFSRVPTPGDQPRAIFITAMDTRAHAPSVEVALAGREEDFQTGIAVLERLTPGPTYVCVAPGSRLPLPDRASIGVVEFDGPHPAGLPGTHIHFLSPVGLNHTVWHVGYQDVAAIGHLFSTGKLDVERVVSLAGPSVTRPRLLRTRLGAALDPLVAGELADGEQRVVSGSVLDGRTAMGGVHGYLGRYHLQVSALEEAGERELFGWIRPGGEKFSIWRVVASAFRRNPRLNLNTSTQGGRRAMVPIGSFERVMPLDIMPTFLLRALLMDDMERGMDLGALELDEDDLALCTFVCPGKAEYGPLLRQLLERIEKEAV